MTRRALLQSSGRARTFSLFFFLTYYLIYFNFYRHPISGKVSVV